MLSVLTANQKALIDELQGYMSGPLAAHGNEAGRLRYGYDKFTEKEYWPIRVNKAETKREAGKTAQAKTVAGFGMAKAPLPDADNGIRIGSYMDTFVRHLDEMATYAAYLNTSEDMKQILNYNFTDAEGEPTSETVQTLLEKVYGEGGVDYWEKLMGDIAQGTKRGREKIFSMDAAMGNVKAAAVGANLRVIAQQPTAILRAMEMINPKYFTSQHLGGWKKAVKYAPIAQWKDWGYFETNHGRSLRSIILGAETTTEWWRETLMKGAGAADSLGWGILWNAAEAETADKHPELGKGTEALYKATAERFTEVVYRTQVVDNVLNRSQYMRSSDGLNKMSANFMSEPTKQYNEVYRAICDVHRAKGPAAKTAAKKQLARTSVALVLSFAAVAAAQAFPDAWRDDDREKGYFAKLKENYIENFAANFNPLSYIPVLKDFVSILSGYDVSRMDMDAIADAWNALVQMWKSIKGEGSKTNFGAGLEVACESAVLLGLPIANIKRDVLGLTNTILTAAKQYRMQYELEKVFYDTDYEKDRTRWWNLLYAAYKNNPEDCASIYKDMLERGFDADKIKAAMNKKIKDEYGVSKLEDLPKGVKTWTPPKVK